MLLTQKNLLGAALLILTVFFAPGITAYAQEQPCLPEGMEDRPECFQGGDNTTETGGGVQFGTVGGIVYDGLTSIGALVAALGGKLLDASLSWFVFDMTGTVRTFELDHVIEDIWALIRDMFNLLFIFGLIFIGFRIILEIDDSGAKRTLGTLVAAALLINFSLYVTQVVVDFGNIAAAQIGAQLVTQGSGATAFGLIEIRNISSGFIAATDLNSISSSTLQMSNELATGRIELPSASLGLRHGLAMGLTIALLLILIGFVFAAGALIMFTRFLYLIFLMMFSPIMFLGWVLPSFKQRSKDWWTKLFNQVLVGPAYLFMLFVALRALEAIVSSRTTAEISITSFLTSSLLVAGFAWAALVVARNIGAVGASTVVNFGESTAKVIRGQVANATVGALGRNSIGRAMDNWNRSMEKRGVSDKNVFRSVASTLAGAKYGGSYSRVSVRESKEKAEQKGARHAQVQEVGRKISAGHNAPAGAAGDAARIEMERAITNASNDQIIEMLGEHKAGSPEYDRIIQHMSASQFDAVMKAKPEELDDQAKSTIAGKRKDAVVSALGGAATLAANIKNASEAQLKVLGAQEIADNAGALKQSQFDDIMKSKDYTETEKNQIRDKRKSQLEAAFALDPAGFLSGRKDKEVAKLPDTILKDPLAAPHLTRNALKQIIHEDTLTPADRATVRTNVSRAGSTDVKKWLRTSEGSAF